MKAQDEIKNCSRQTVDKSKSVKEKKNYLEILQITDDYVACIKPSGVESEHEMSGLLSEAAGKTASDYFCVHRLDKAVSGVMIFARNSSAAASLSDQIQSGLFIKEYYAIVAGTPLPAEGRMEDLLFKDRNSSKTYPVKRMRRGVKKAVLEYKVLSEAKTETGDAISLVRVKLITGRYHQIRAQFASRKMPLFGDSKYGSRIKSPIALYSCRITFDNNLKGRKTAAYSLPAAAHESKRSPAPAESVKPVCIVSVPRQEYPWNVFPEKDYKIL